MAVCLGIDTSNYTTSLALVKNGQVTANLKKSVYVGENERGVRQSDALFCHVKNLPALFEELGALPALDAVGWSSRPRDVEGSYMPCFLAGELAGRALAAHRGIGGFPFSHQAGHLRAALYSAGAEELTRAPFLAFHVSGGTTEMLLVREGRIEKIGGTVDLTAGQAIDRVGVYLGMRFPCGPEMEKAAAGCTPPKARISVKGTECNLSGVENLARKMADGGAPKGETAAFVIEFIRATLEKLTENAFLAYGEMPVVYAGGVMSCSIVRRSLQRKFHAYFAEPAFSSDNAAGTALLCHDAFTRGEKE